MQCPRRKAERGLLFSFICVIIKCILIKTYYQGCHSNVLRQKCFTVFSNAQQRTKSRARSPITCIWNYSVGNGTSSKYSRIRSLQSRIPQAAIENITTMYLKSLEFSRRSSMKGRPEQLTVMTVHYSHHWQRKRTLFLTFGLNSPSGIRDSSPTLSMKGSHRFTMMIRTVKWTANQKETDKTRLQWKIEVGGRAFSSLLRGFEKDIKRKRMLIAIPIHVAYESPILTPSRQRALIV